MPPSSSTSWTIDAATAADHGPDAASEAKSRPRYGRLILGLALVLAYILLPARLDPVTRGANELGTWIRSMPENDWNGTMLWFLLEFMRYSFSGLATGYLRVIFWLIPAWLLITSGLASLIRPAQADRLINTAVQRGRWIVIGSACLAMVTAGLLSMLVLESHPITWGDEFSYRFHAELLADGRLYADPPPDCRAFRNRAFVCDDRWYGIGLGGHPLVLSLGHLLGSVRIVPPILAAISVVLTFTLVRELYDRPTAILASLMLGLSPLFVFYHATLLPESTHMVVFLGFLVLLVTGDRKRSLPMLAGSALCLAFALVTRLQTACIMALPVGVWLIFRRDRKWREKAPAVAIFGMGVVAGALGLFTYAHLVSGDPFGSHLSPGYHHDEVGGAAALGIDYLTSFIASCLRTLVTLINMNFVLLGWPVSLIALGYWLRRKHKTRWDYLIFASVVMVFWFYWMYPAQHEQYFVEAGVLLVILAAVGLISRYRQRSHQASDHRSYVVCAALAGYLLACVGVWPVRAEYFHERSDHEREVWQPIRAAGVHQAIVFLENLPDEYANCTGRNSPDLDNDVILAKVLNPREIPRLAAMFPDRAPYRLYRTTPGAGLILEPFDETMLRPAGDQADPSTGVPLPSRDAGQPPRADARAEGGR